MGKSIARTRKRKFYGNGNSKNFENSSTKDDGICTASTSKLKTTTPLLCEKNEESASGNRIFDLAILISVFSELCCPKCFANELNLCEETRYGLCSHFVLKCKKCDFCKGFTSSKKSVNLSEINTRLVYGMRQIGKGFSAAYKLCATLNMPKLSKTAYTAHEQKLLKTTSEVAEESMKKAAYDLTVVKQQVSSETVKCGVSVDGTWQRRGYTSLNGCVAAISVDTGKVLDFEVLSAYCPVCKRLEKLPRNLEYHSLKADHVCHCNFQGSSAKMETVGVSRIFCRSEETRQLQYTGYYGDGDSKGFMGVKHIYGENSVTKLECIGHVQKRVGTRLRKLKAKNKKLSGKGKLTDTFIDRLQNYYGIAIRSNIGNLQTMQQNVIAALFHCASNLKTPMHGQCPLGKDSWCFYQRALVCGTTTKNKYAGLPNDVLNAIKPAYLELCSRELLSKCLHGKTQNANECFNGILWQRIPKDVFVCLKTLKLGANDAVIQFNDGFKGCLNVFSKLNIPNPGYFTLKGYEHLDSIRIRDSKRFSEPKIKNRRKVLRALRKKKSQLLK